MFKPFKKLTRNLNAYLHYDPDLALLETARDRIDLELMDREIERRRSSRR